MDDKLKYCLCTEATDMTFPYLRVMLSSFIKHNSGWFKGKLVILTCDITPLSKANRKIIKKWYSDVEYIDIKPSTYELIRCSDKEKIHLYKTEAFNLDTYDIILYVSHLSLCLSDCSRMFKGDADIVGCNNDVLSDSIKGMSKRPSKASLKTINTSVLLLSNEVSKHNLANYILDSIISKRVSKKDRDMCKLVYKHTNDSFVRKSLSLTIHGLPSSSVMKKSIYGDHKTKVFNSLLPAAYFIELDVGIFEQSNSASNRYKNVNRLWLSHNKDEFWYDESNVSKVGPLDLHRVRIEARKTRDRDRVLKIRKPKRNTISISTVSVDQIADYIQNKRVCLVANSSDLLYNELGEFIDSHDIVVRFNGYKIDKKHTGIKTNIHASIYLSKSRLNEDVDYRLIIANNRSKWQSSIRKNIKKDKQIAIIDMNWPISMNRKKEFFKITPTTGLNAISFFKTIGGFAELNLIGFNFYDKGSSSVYRDNDTVGHIAKVHNYKFEKKWVYQRFNKTAKHILTYDNKST
jgi:cellobiose-specific phosphotransferase system component IIB